MNRDNGSLNNGESSALKEEEPDNVIDVTADSFPPPLVKVMKDITSKSSPAWCPASHHPASCGPISGSIDDAYSLYLNYLPFDATPAQVEEEFKRFGLIKPGAMQVKRYKLQNSCFGFVEFKFSDVVQQAIEGYQFVAQLTGTLKFFVLMCLVG
ncbi:hypothetical protein ZIOFF_025202 [Zingiber officinale]|uniref:RRM domain-containing protein n=1 Tax=Zingiber officinale TaxID=94328 RepID=A0A8J5H0H6_ZINOF|nr:hypothetical protein ZIOFF_025202 [Zingiber officinale]